MPTTRYIVTNANDPAVQTRFWAKVDRQGLFGCWIWTAGTDQYGYGRFGAMTTVGKRPIGAHRMAHLILVGPMPEDLELDHLCRTPACVNPAHLELVTHLENVRRGNGGMPQRQKTQCPSGHPYDQRNTRWYQGRRYCRACSSAFSLRRYYARKAAAA